MPRPDMLGDLAPRVERNADAPLVRKRYGLLPHGTIAIAKIKIMPAKDKQGRILPSPVKESKGAAWFDVRYTLEGRYQSRWVFQRFMLKGKSEETLQKRDESHDLLSSILSLYGKRLALGASQIDGLRVPVEIVRVEEVYVDGQERRKKTVNRARILRPGSPAYHDLAKRAKVVTPDPINAPTVIDIDLPGWRNLDDCATSKMLWRRLDKAPGKAARASERAIAQMAGEIVNNATIARQEAQARRAREYDRTFAMLDAR